MRLPLLDRDAKTLVWTSQPRTTSELYIDMSAYSCDSWTASVHDDTTGKRDDILFQTQLSGDAVC